MQLSSPAMAQSSAYGKWVFDSAGLATPAFVYDAPPAGFNPLTASDVELEQYGFPPRPPQSDSARYSVWKRAARATRVAPQLIPTNIYNGPVRNVKIGLPMKSAAQGTTCNSNSDNWGGYAVTGANGTFTVNHGDVSADWSVPHARFADFFVTPEVAEKTVVRRFRTESMSKSSSSIGVVAICPSRPHQRIW